MSPEPSAAVDGRTENAKRSERVFHVFYTTARLGARMLSDGGGPFGFDIQTALQIDHVIATYPVDALVETGCATGDTTDYLTRAYPNLPVTTCDINPRMAAITRRRLAERPNATVLTGDSAELLPSILADANCPLVYMDAHWEQAWPLAHELRAMRTGMAVIDDFDIDHPRFGYDTYNGQPCNAGMVSVRPDVEHAFIGNPAGTYPYPCLQVGRRTGRCYVPFQLDPHVMRATDMFRELDLDQAGDRLQWTKSTFRV